MLGKAHLWILVGFLGCVGCTKQLESSVPYQLVYEVSESGSGLLPMVVMFHSEGKSEGELSDLLDGVAVPHRQIRFRGPFTQGSGYSWRDDAFDQTVFPILCRSVAQSMAELTAKYPTKGRAIAVGYSQGGAVALGLGALHGEQFQYAASLGGWLPTGMEPSPNPLPAVGVTLFHGTDDDVVPFARAAAAEKTFAAGGVQVSIEQNAGGHEILEPMAPNVAAQVSEWLSRL